jgi:protein-disulfide isomerase
LKSKYIDSGEVRFVFRELPRDNGLDLAATALTRSVGTDKFFDFVDLLMKKQSDWLVDKPEAPLRAIAKEAGIDDKQFGEILHNQDLLQGIVAMRQRAIDDFGVDSTPTFFINGKKVVGFQSMQDLDKVIQPLLKKT